MSARESRPDAPRRRVLWLVLLGVAAVALFSTLVPLQTILYGTPLLAAMPLIAGLSVAPLLARTSPRIAIALFSVTAIALSLLVSPDRDPAAPWPWSVPALIAAALFVFVITYLRGWRTGLVPWGVAMTGTLLIPLISPGPVTTEASTANLIVAASITGAASLAAVLVESRIRIGAELSRSEQRTEAEQARRVLIEERTRIARELHDVVAHSMSVIQVQASTARYRLPELPAGAVTEFEDIASTARGSLTEMRRLLSVLRTDEGGSPQLAPQQGLADIRALVDGIRRAGAEVRLALDAPETLPPGVQITAFRIVQEALSNAVRHAPGAPVAVEVTATTTELTLRVHNEAASPAAADRTRAADRTPAADRGHGLAGMRERVALLAGELLAGPDPAGGWTVAAILPITDIPEPS